MSLTKADKAEVAAMITRGVVAAAPMQGPELSATSPSGDWSSTVMEEALIEEAALKPDVFLIRVNAVVLTTEILNSGIENRVMIYGKVSGGGNTMAKFAFPPNHPEHLVELKRIQNHLMNDMGSYVAFSETDDVAAKGFKIETVWARASV